MGVVKAVTARKARESAMADVGLAEPPTVITTNQQCEEMLTVLRATFDFDSLDKETVGEEHRRHRDLYLARKIAPKVRIYLY